MAVPSRRRFTPFRMLVMAAVLVSGGCLLYPDQHRRLLGILAFVAAAGMVQLAILVALRNKVYRRRHRPGHCPNCGYDRSGLPTDAPCPECGRA